jgi:hypothetical protein
MFMSPLKKNVYVSGLEKFITLSYIFTLSLILSPFVTSFSFKKITFKRIAFVFKVFQKEI